MYGIVAGNLPLAVLLAAGSLVVRHLRRRTASCTPLRSKLATFQSHMSGTAAR